MNHKRNTIQGIKWTSIDKWSREIISFVVLIYLARLLDPASFGIVALGKVLISFLEIFYEKNGLSLALIQREKLEDNHKDAAFWFNIVVAIFMIIVAIALSGYIARFFGEPLLQPIIIMLAFSIIAQSLSSVQIGLLKREFKFSILAKRNIATSIISGIVGLSMAYAGFGVWSLVGLYVTKSFVGMILLWYAASWRPKFAFSPDHFRDLFGFSVYLFCSGLVTSISKQSDKILIGKILAMEMVGIYKISQVIVRNVNSLISAAISNVALPVFSRMQNDDKKLLYTYYLNVRLSLFLTAPVFVILISFPELILEKVLGEQWLGGTVVLQLLAIFGLIESISFFNGPILYAKGNTKYVLYLTISNSILRIGLILLFISHGIEGVAFAVLISAILNHIAFIYFIKKITNLRVPRHLLNIGIGIIPAVIMFFGMHRIMLVEFEISHIYHVVVSLVIGISIYVLAINTFDRNLIIKISREIKKVKLSHLFNIL